MSEHPIEAQQDSSTPQALVIAIQRPGQTDDDILSSCKEMERLAATLGISVVATEIQKRSSPSSSTFVGSGKLKELALLTGGPGEVSTSSEESEEVEALEELAEKPVADMALVDAELSPRQQRILEISLGVEVLDRTAVILEIFEKRAGTREASLEVEIARLQYELPRQRDDSSKNDRQGGGGRGERGHTNVELSKERIRDRIAQLKAELADVQTQATSQRAQRQAAFQVVLVGYTNAGKSSLMRGLTGSEVFVEDQLFATLGTTIRKLQPATTPAILVSDTVGFIKNLPHELVASFRSTLDEALDADHILLVVDSSDPDWRRQREVTRETLASIGVSKIAHTLVLNKVDRLDEETRSALAEEFPEAIQLSALRPEDLETLHGKLADVQDKSLCEETLLIPFAEGHLLGEIHERARLIEESHSKEGTILHLRARSANLDRWRSKLPDPANVETIDDLLALAARYGLELITEEEEFDDSGLDFRVVQCCDEDETPWIVRSPRRDDVFVASRVEGRALRLLRDRLSVEIPEWRLHTPEVIAYPQVKGTPMWTITEAGTPEYHLVDPESLGAPTLQSLATTLVALQSVPVSEAVAANLPVKSIDEIRQERRQKMLDTREVLKPSDEVWERWNRWLDNDKIWPRHNAMIHGDLHPGHILLDKDARLVGLLDWTEAKIADPAQDFTIFYGCFGKETLSAFLEEFEGAGGRIWPGIFDYIIELWSFYPVDIAAWAVEHDDKAVLEHARGHLKKVTASIK